MKTFHLTLVAAFLLSASVHAEDFAEALQKSKSAGNSSATIKFIDDSYQAKQNNPEYFIASANYLWQLSGEVSISTKPAGPGDFTVANATNNTAAGSISTVGKVNPEIPRKAVALLQDATKRFPERADIALGLAFLQRELNEPDACLATLRQFLTTAAADPGKLTWKNGGEFPDPPATFIPVSLQSYSAYFFNAETPEGDKRCRELCEKIIATYPDHAYAYNMMAALSGVADDKAAALKYLKIAHEKAPDDPLILLNLGEIQLELGDKATAATSFKAVLALDAEPEYTAAAKAKLGEIGAEK